MFLTLTLLKKISKHQLEGMVAHLEQNSNFYVQRETLIYREIFLFSDDILYSVNFSVIWQKLHMQSRFIMFSKFFLYSEKFFKFRESFLFKETFCIQRKSLTSKTTFIVRENVDIQRKYVYSE